MLKIRRPLGRLIFNMGIAIPGKTVFLIETAPCLIEKIRRCYGRFIFTRISPIQKDGIFVLKRLTGCLTKSSIKMIRFAQHDTDVVCQNMADVHKIVQELAHMIRGNTQKTCPETALDKSQHELLFPHSHYAHLIISPQLYYRDTLIPQPTWSFI